MLKELYSLMSANKYAKPTIIFLETPHRIKESLEDLKEVFGDIEIIIARELTKIHEETWRGKIFEAQKREWRGELVLLFAPNPDV